MTSAPPAAPSAPDDTPVNSQATYLARGVLPAAVPVRWIDRINPRQGTLLGLMMVAAVGWADYLSGYAIRLSLLQFLPIALVSWTAGIGAGIGFSLLTVLIWLVSFEETHPYAHDVYFAWEGLIILVGYLVVAILVARLRHALHNADQRFSRLVEGLPVAVAVIHPHDGTLGYRNPAMARLLDSLPEFSPEAFVTPWLERPERAAGSAGATHSIRTGNQQVRWFDGLAGEIPWTGGESRRLLVLSEVTERRSAAELRERHREAVHEASRLITLAEIAATLAHEINQPLMTIATYTDACQRLMESGKADAEQIATALARCHAQAVRASSIIERLRDFVRHRRGRSEACDAVELSREALDLAGTLFDEPGIRLEVSLPALPIVLSADRHLVVQALVNLLRNAADALQESATPAPRIVLELGFDGREASWRISDNGPGIPAELRDTLFSPFQTTRPQGLGLGLAISRSIAESHGGTLSLSDCANTGACFVLTLPRRQPDA